MSAAILGRARLLFSCITLLIASLGITACGGGGSPDTSSNSSQTTTDDSNSDPAIPVFKSCGTENSYNVNMTRGYVRHILGGFFIPEDLATFECSQSPSFARDANNLYVGTKQYPVSDFSNLRFINDNYMTDESIVYGAEKAHADSFEVINPGKSQIHAKDLYNIYLNGFTLDNVDYDSFQVFGERMAMDNSGFIITSSQRYPYASVIFNGLDIINFVALGGSYFRSPTNEIYYFVTNGAVGMRLMSGVDANSFAHISGDYAKDANSYYYMSAPFSSGASELTLLGGNYSTDGVNFYAGSRLLSGADAATFQVNPVYKFAYDSGTIYRTQSGSSGSASISTDTTNLRVAEGGFIFTDTIVTDVRLRFSESPAQVQYLGGGFLRGANGVYYLGIQLQGVNAQSFTYLGLYRYFSNTLYSMGKDINSVYRGPTAVNTFDTASFELSSLDFARDATSIFYGQFSIIGADRNTFEILGRNHARDVNNAYFAQYVITGANPGNVVVVDDDYAYDSSSYYFQRSSLAPYTPNALTVLEAGYSTVGNSAYFQNTLLSGVDIASFQVIVPYYVVNRVSAIAADANNLYAGPNTIAGYSLDLNTFRTWNDDYFGDDQNVFNYMGFVSSTNGFIPP